MHWSPPVLVTTGVGLGTLHLLQHGPVWGTMELWGLVN